MKLNLVQDWIDYDKSLLCQQDYYLNNGVSIYLLEHPYPVPSLLTNSRAHAESVLEVIKANLDDLPEQVRILDIGSGSGCFGANLLDAAKDAGCLDRLQFIFSDLSEQAVKELETSEMLKDFHNHIQFMQVDALAPIKLKDISVITMNYVYDALPMLPVNNGQKMQVKLLEPVEAEPNPFPMQNLVLESRWQDYDPEDEVQKKYHKYLENDLYFNYKAIEMTDKLSQLLCPNGFIAVAEMIESKSKLAFDLYGNTCAHAVSEMPIIRAMEAQGMEALLAKDSQLMRIFFFNNPETKTKLKDLLYQEFNQTTRTDKLLQGLQN